MIAAQYSELVDAAQQANALDAYATDLMHALSIYALPAPLAHTGLRFSYSAPEQQLAVRAHGKLLHSRYEHVWLTDKTSRPRLGGRLQFHLEARQGDNSQVIYEILFDALGNARIDHSHFFGNSIRKEDPELREALRRISLAIINAIHDSMDRVDGTVDA
ncbi:MAG TPA: hypothetical protein VKC56_12910 [Gallionellaceae bacterium]|nr:hypothetical protein [Gallionellaceae bacterium]